MYPAQDYSGALSPSHSTRQKETPRQVCVFSAPRRVYMVEMWTDGGGAMCFSLEMGKWARIAL